MNTPQRTINKSFYGKWHGYEGGRKVKSFGMDKERAKRWLNARGHEPWIRTSST